MGKFELKLDDSKIKGAFNIYQARKGTIFLLLGNGFTELTLQQVQELKIDVYALDEFDYKLFKKAYNIE